MQYYLIFFSFLLCLGLTPLVRLVAVKKGWMAYPTKERWHKKPTALFGGCAIYAAVSIPLLIVADFRTIWPHIIRTSEGLDLPSIGAAIWIGMSFLFILGLLDDIFRIKPQTKLVGQILIASIISFLGFRLHWFISPTLDTLITIIWVIIACKFAAFFALGIYKGIWASMDSNDALLYLKASTLATILSVAAVTYIYRFVDFSKGVFFIDWLLTNAFLLGTRGSFKLFVDTIKRKTLEGQRVLIYGAGCGGELLLRELLNNNKLKTKPEVIIAFGEETLK